MPSLLSKELSAKILGKEWSFGYNCYEVGHTWTPSCTDAALEVSLAAGMKIMPLYAMLYTFSQLAVQRKYDLPATWDTVKSIMRSSFFIFFHAYNGSVMGCALRRGFGRFYYRVLVFAPAIISSYLSLIIEKPNRRQALAFYLLNLASEIVYRMSVTKGYFKPIKHGETLLFAISLGAWFHLLKEHGFGHDPVSGAVKVLIGRDEAKSRSSKSRSVVKVDDGYDDDNNYYNHLSKEKALSEIKMEKEKKKKNSIIAHCLNAASTNKLNDCVDSIGFKYLDGRHECCPHKERTCFNYIISPIPTRFLLGYTIQATLKLINKPALLMAQPKKALRDSLFYGTSGGSQSIRFGLFLVTLVSSGRLTNCLLRRYSNSNDCPWHGAVSGFASGLSMLLAPRSSLSMYVMWKAVEQYYLLAARQGKVKYFDFTILTIYACSAATILYTFALEPKFVRPSYMKFLDNISNHRLHQLNRMVLDVFGTGSSVGYEDYFPDLDPKLMSNQFKELVFNWMIQPYE